ncbi:MAG: T9SS type A sorting domain-containing protein [Bacteroidota bacterium]
MVYFGGMASARARRDDDDDDDDCGLNSPPQNNPALNQAKKKLEEAKADVEKALSNLTVAFNKASVAEAKAKAYEKDAENLTGRVEQAVTWLDAVKENVREKAKNYLSRVQEAANARADMADAEGVAEKAAQKASDMKNSAKAYKAEAKKNRQIADELKRLAEIAEDTYEEDEGVALLLEWQYTVALEQHKASLGGGNTFGNAIEDLDLAMMKIKVDAAKAKAKYSQFQYNKAKRKFKEADQTATLAEQLAKNAEQIAKLAQASAEKAKKEAADARAAAQAADQAVTDADQELVRAMAAQSDAERKLAFVTNEAEIATALVELARNDVERAVEKVKEAQKALTDAQKKLKASAEVVEALQFPDDDDDNPGVPPIVPVTHYVADPELNPYSFINASNAFGKSYLFGEQYYDDLLFHNPSITEQGKLDFQDHFLTCAARAFEKEPCDLLSPMPVVLIEVVIRNAELRAIKIPGLPEISAGLLQSALPLYDNELNAHYINVTAADQYITSNGYKVIEADFPEQVHPIGFPKYDHVKVPDFNNSPSQEFKTDNWNRTILAGTYNALSGLQKQLEARASAADVDAEEYFSITHMSHEFMKVKKVPEGNDVLTYELWSLTLNKEFVSKFNATVTAEGPFEVSNGLSDTKPLHEWQDNEIFVRAATKDLSIADNAVEAAIENGAIKIYPNPAREIVHIEFTLLRKSPVRLRFFDMFGNIIYDEEEMLDAGVHHKTINDVKNFHPGMYVVVISANFEQQVSRIAIE